jgi:endonuclease/exonuclease/phosphatase family metal-dependent hydrolase
MHEGEAATAFERTGFRVAVQLPEVRTRPPRGVFDSGRSIDWIFLAGKLNARKGWVHGDARGSDHLPVSFVLSLS